MTIQCRLPPPYSSAQHHAPLIQHQGELLAQVQASTDLRNDAGGVCVCVFPIVKLSERTRAFQETLLPCMLYALYVFVQSIPLTAVCTPMLMKINESLSSLWLASTKTWCLASQRINTDLKKKKKTVLWSFKGFSTAALLGIFISFVWVWRMSSLYRWEWTGSEM